jgi:hypothetical protein
MAAWQLLLISLLFSPTSQPAATTAGISSAHSPNLFPHFHLLHRFNCDNGNGVESMQLYTM